ncbi:MAG: DUF2194 domain-containing protein [Spirochaetales bacterium]|nr:DUF2194 domain-containing protein [Spirochaetales bacterium]
MTINRLPAFIAALLLFSVLITSCGFFKGSADPRDLLEIRTGKYEPVEADYPGRKILALYKSSNGQTAKENEIFYHLSLPLEEMGFTIQYRDIDEGIPDANALKNVRTIITWFRDSSLSDPEAYIAFLNSAINSGRKVIVIGNFGAYQYRDEKEKYVRPALLNLPLSKLGLWYMGDWTDDASLLEVAGLDPSMVEAEAKQDASKSSFFYRFIKTDRDMNVYLSVRRKDKNYPPSPFIVTNKNGGFAFPGYIYKEDKDGKINFLLNLKDFLRESLFPKYTSEKVVLIADKNDYVSKGILVYTEDILHRVNIPYKTIDRAQFKNMVPGDLRQFSTALLILRNETELDPKILEEYLNGGGSIISLLAGDLTNLSSLLASTGVEGAAREKTGFRINAGFALGENLVPADDEEQWYPGSLLPDKDAAVMGTDYGGDTPLLWSADSHGGKVLVWNWDGFYRASLAGLILQSILYVRPAGAAPVIGAGHMFIDDWPLPMYDTVKKPLTITDTEFYTKIWWPEIKALFTQRSIPCSAHLIFNYNGVVSPPFTGAEFFASEKQSSLSSARDILSSDTELGFHGYNHMSLTLENTDVNMNNWPSLQAMESSLLEGKKLWVSLLGKETLPFGYVAVNNIISEDGIKALHNVFPSIKIISALKWGVEGETYTPLGPYEHIPGLYYIPRVSFGYRVTNEVKNLIISGANAFGFTSHFIHPDDVFDPYRSDNKNWEELKSEFTAILDFIKTHYPWIKWKSLRQLYYTLQEQDAINFSSRWKGPTLELTITPNTLFQLRMNRGPYKRITGALPVYTYGTMPVQILKAVQKHVEIEF